MTHAGMDERSAADVAGSPGSSRSLWARGREQLTPRRATLVIAIAQASWLAVLIGRGWFSEADLSRMADANGERLDWSYLSNSAGGHFAPLDRLVFWLLNRTVGMDWGITVAYRVILAAAATVLLAHLLELLVGPRPWLNIVLVCYAFSPLLVPGLAWLTSGAGFAPAQVLIILTLIAHVRHARTGGWRSGIAVGLLLFLALDFQDQAILTIAILVLLSLGFLHVGSLPQRIRASARRWKGWTSVVVFVGLFIAAYTGGQYSRGSSSYNASAALRIMWQEWTDVIAPAFVGGPWKWWSIPTSYIPFADPQAELILAGQVVFFTLIVLSVRATGRRAFVAWLIPVIVMCGGVALAGFGRFDVTGTFVAPTYRYSFTGGVALALGVTLAFARPNRESDAPRAPASHNGLRLLAVAVFIAACVVSSLGFDQRFSQNDADRYVDNLVASARAIGPNGNVYDSSVSHNVMSFFDDHHYVSDVLSLAGVKVTYDQSNPNPLVVGSDGRLVPSVFVKSADNVGPYRPNCGTPISGRGTWTLTLNRPLRVQDWYLRLQTYQARPTTLSVRLVDLAGNVIRPVQGGQVVFAHKLDSILLRLPVSAPSAVVLQSSDPTMTMCVVHTYLGAPVPAAE